MGYLSCTSGSIIFAAGRRGVYCSDKRILSGHDSWYLSCCFWIDACLYCSDIDSGRVLDFAGRSGRSCIWFVDTAVSLDYFRCVYGCAYYAEDRCEQTIGLQSDAFGEGQFLYCDCHADCCRCDYGDVYTGGDCPCCDIWRDCLEHQGCHGLARWYPKDNYTDHGCFLCCKCSVLPMVYRQQWKRNCSRYAGKRQLWRKLDRMGTL